MDPTKQHLISSAVTSGIIAAMTSMHTKYEEEILALREMIKKSLLLREPASFTLSLDSNASNKASALSDFPSRTTKRWNQADLGYFDPYLDEAYSKGEIVSIGKDVYYKNMVLFI